MPLALDIPCSNPRPNQPISFFDEHIGCTPCEAFDASESRSGPWILPSELGGDGDAAALTAVMSKYSCDECTCKQHRIEAAPENMDSSASISYASGPSIPITDDWEMTLVDCTAVGINCTFDGVLYD